jgi:release factor glutamine methyltransferase
MSLKIGKSSRYFINYAESKLKEAEIDNYRKEAEILVSEIFGLSSIELFIEEHEPGTRQIQALEEALDKRCRHVPLAYIFNKASFYGSEFYIDERVLIPRPETEILVESVSNFLNSNKLSDKTVVDIGTGCGNIAISLTKHLSSCKIMATDICPQAIEVARKNIKNFGFEANITLLEGDLFAALKGYEGKIDVVVSNPPYISEVEMNGLSAEVSREPYISLYGGQDGLDLYRRFFQKAATYLSKNGLMVLEIGYNQAEALRLLSETSKNFSCLQIIKDYRKLDRVICCRKN